MVDEFAQRSRRQDETIAELLLGIDDDERQVLGEREILVAVVHHDDVGAVCHGKCGAFAALARDDDRCGRCQ